MTPILDGNELFYSIHSMYKKNIVSFNFSFIHPVQNGPSSDPSGYETNVRM